MNLEIFKLGTESYEVLDYYGYRLFEGTEAVCEDYIADYEIDDAEDSEFD
jgi:hypothetical protein